MEVRFKFRSSPTYDTVDIGQQSSISIRDLKSKIVLKKHLNLCLDFDLVFSDSLSGQEFTDETAQIPCGSSVIIKRVPAKSTRVSDTSVGRVGDRDADCVKAVRPLAVDFGLNDFGADLRPPLDANLLGYSELPSNIVENKNFSNSRCLGELPVENEKLEATHPSQFDPKDSITNDAISLEMQSKPTIEEPPKLDRTLNRKHVAVDSYVMPSELKCSLCTTFFKEAVMIPCCQHSFCEKCIRLALAENPRCPMCSSTKSRSEDLLPNLSLRQAIDRFLEPQLLQSGSENDLDRFAPDGESGIQVRELSYAASVPQRDSHFNQPTGKGLNKFLDNSKHNTGTLEDSTEFQGENEPQSMAETNEEANFGSRKGQHFCDVTGGGKRTFTAPRRLNKGLRTCYMCGSPDHLIRECPSAASSRTGNWNGDACFQGVGPGYGPTFWPGSPPNVRPFPHMYGGPGMIFYNNIINNSMAPATPFAFPPYAPPMYGGYPRSSESLNFGGVVPHYRISAQPPAPGTNAQPMGQREYLGIQGPAKQHRSLNTVLERQLSGYQDHNVNRQHECAERGPNRSCDSFPRTLEGKYRSHERSDDSNECLNIKRQDTVSRPREGGRESKDAQSDKSTSDKAMPDARIRCREGRHDKAHRTSRKDDDMRRNHGSDSGEDHHHSNREIVRRKRRIDHDERRSDREFHSHSGSGFEPSHSSGDGRRRQHESGHMSRHLKKKSNPKGKATHHEREKMAKYSDDDYGEDYHSHKRKRLH